MDLINQLELIIVCLVFDLVRAVFCQARKILF